jgi:hypothetical protein
VSDGLDRDVRALPVGEVAHPGDSVLAALGDDVGGTEFDAQVGAVGVPAHQDDAFGPEPPGGQHGRQPDRSVVDHRDGGVRRHASHVHGVVPGQEHVRQCEQRVEHGLVGVLERRAGLDEGAVGLGDTYGLGLGAAHAAGPEEVSVDAGGLHSLAAVHARVVLDAERADHEVPGTHRGDVGADLLDHAQELVPHRAGLPGVVVVAVQVRSAHARAHHAHDRVARILQDGVGHLVHPHITCAVQERREHRRSSLCRRHRVGALVDSTAPPHGTGRNVLARGVLAVHG